MGVGPVAAVPRLLEQQGLKIEDIELWKLNEAYAAQDKLNVNAARFQSAILIA